MWQSGLQWSFNYIWLAKLQGIRLGAANFWNGVLHGHLFGFTGKFRIAINTSGQVLGVSILRCRVRRIAAYVLSMPDLLTGANGFAKKVWSRLARYFFSVLWVPTHAFGLQSGRRGLPSSYYTSGVPGYLQQTSVAVINPEMILSIYPILNRSWLWSWFARPFFRFTKLASETPREVSAARNWHEAPSHEATIISSQTASYFGEERGICGQFVKCLSLDD